MSDESIRVTISAGETIFSWRSVAEQAAHAMTRRLEIDSATWEPHDWSEWPS